MYPRRDHIDLAEAERQGGACICGDPECLDRIWSGQVAYALGSLVQAIEALTQVSDATRQMWPMKGEPGGCEDPHCHFEQEMRGRFAGVISAVGMAGKELLAAAGMRRTDLDQSYDVAFYRPEAEALRDRVIAAMQATGISHERVDLTLEMMGYAPTTKVPSVFRQ